MKRLLIFVTALFYMAIAGAQSYPEPEFSKEVYYLKKENVSLLTRLEKGTSKIESKTKLGGMGGSESAYLLDGEHSAIRIAGGSQLSFVFSNGESGELESTASRDSIMRANGMDPAMLKAVNSMNDPSGTIVLYKVEVAGGKRKVMLQKNPGMSPFGSKKQKSSEKFSFSVKKVRQGYWELVVDKPLPKGEYAFTLMGGAQQGMDGSTPLFAFGVD